MLTARWRLLQALLDLAAWSLAALPAREDGVPWVTATLVAWAVHLPVAWSFRLYRGRYRFGSFDEALGLCRAWVTTTAALITLGAFAGGAGTFTPLESVATACIAAVLMAATRVARRASRERAARSPDAAKEKVILFGAGDGGSQIIRAMLEEPHSPYRPVALLDDDPGKQSLRIMDVPVVGDRDALEVAARYFGARRLVVAVPSAGADLLRSLSAAAERAGIPMQVLPTVDDLVSGRIRTSDIRDVNLVDLIGRRAVDTDVQAVCEHLRDRRVLVTGAGGSIGSELCRVISEYSPAKLFMLDRDESALHALQLSLTGRAMLDSDELVLADIRDAAGISEVFERLRPDVVFHAAALKHLTLLETFPAEAVKTNVHGTLAVLDAAARSGVQHFVNVSTDKAADPVSALGYSKRLAERLTADVAMRYRRNYVSVRFGNVLASRGSVLTAFAAQAAAGGPLTVTDPEVTRFFMTIREAVQLMLQASAVSRSGDVLVLDMGEPVRIAEVAERVAATVDHPVSIVYTGLRPGEKMHEALFGAGEKDVRPFHPLVSQVPVPPLDRAELGLLDLSADEHDLIGRMRTLCLAPAMILLDPPEAPARAAGGVAHLTRGAAV
jgi:FlaA1/EpsC-like NDP-sugar epimerase